MYYLTVSLGQEFAHGLAGSLLRSHKAELRLLTRQCAYLMLRVLFLARSGSSSWLIQVVSRIQFFAAIELGEFHLV